MVSVESDLRGRSHMCLNDVKTENSSIREVRRQKQSEGHRRSVVCVCTGCDALQSVLMRSVLYSSQRLLKSATWWQDGSAAQAAKQESEFQRRKRSMF